MRRNQSPHSPLTWSVTILLTWATFVSISDSKTITCKVPSVLEGTQAILTCDYGEKMVTGSSGKDIIIEHHPVSGTPERILDCYWKDGASSYTCPTKKEEGLTSISDMWQHVTVPFLAEKNKEGLYYCKTLGPGITSTPCNFTIKESITCQVPSVEEGQQAILTCDYGQKMSTGSSGKDIVIKHFTDSGTSEFVLDCYWKKGANNYTCPTSEAQANITPNMGQYVTVTFPAKENKEGWYSCRTPGFEIPSTPCSFTIKESITCQVPSVEEGQQAILTCDYGKKMSTGDSGKNISVEHYFLNGTSELVLDCYWEKGANNYTCPTSKVQANITPNMGQSVTVEFLAEKNKEGMYYCNTSGHRIDSTPCSFTIKAKPEGHASSGVALTLAIIIPIFVIGVVVLVVIVYRKKKKYSGYKRVVVSNAAESLISIACSMGIMNEKLEPERADDAQLLATKAGTGFAAGVPADLPPVMARLWKDPKLQDFVGREAENLQLDSGVYFLNSLDRITAPDYKPTKQDVDKAWVKQADAGKTSFTFQALHQRCLNQRNSTAEGAASDLARETDRLLPGNEKTLGPEQPPPGGHMVA